MKSRYVVVALVLFISSLLYSQEITTNPKYALSFGISENFRLNKFIMDISGKKILDESHQLRLFLAPRISSKLEEVETSGTTQSQDIESLNYSLGVGADYLWILIKNEDINMFGGTGLIITYGFNNSKSTSNGPNNEKSVNELNNQLISAGIRGTVGVEWMVSNKIGIHSEYIFTGSYNYNDSENKFSLNGTANPTNTRTSNGILLDSVVLFGVSIYF